MLDPGQPLARIGIRQQAAVYFRATSAAYKTSCLTWATGFGQGYWFPRIEQTRTLTLGRCFMLVVQGTIRENALIACVVISAGVRKTPPSRRVTATSGGANDYPPYRS